jgi:hypothetical protein
VNASTGPVKLAWMSAAKVGRGLIVLGVSVGYLTYLFRPFHSAFWDTGMGDWMDPYFINYLLEHWYQSLTSLYDPASPPMYFPVAHTLGYSHALILYVPFFVPIRLFVHPFPAYSLALAAVMETGIVYLYLLLRRRFHLSFLESLLLTVFFFTSPNVVNGGVSVWSQRASVFLIPPILCLGAMSYCTTDRYLKIGGAALTGLLAALLFTHDFYTALFAAFFSVLAIPAFARASLFTSLVGFWRSLRRPERTVLALVVAAFAWTCFVVLSGGVELHVGAVRIASHNWRRPAWLAGLSLLVFLALRRDHWLRATPEWFDGWLRAWAAGAAIGAMVFLWIYLPTIRQNRRFPDADLLNALTARDPWHAYSSLGSFGLVSALCIAAILPWSRAAGRTRRAAAWSIAISLVVLLIPIRSGGLSLWMMVFRWLPGFSVIRDPTRIIYVYELAAVMAVAWLLTRLPGAAALRAGVVIALAALIATGHNRDIFEGYRPRADFRRWVEAPIAVDPACRSFFVKGASSEYMSRSPHMWTLYGIDAMFVALRVSLPTLNGYSAWTPVGWNLLNPHEADYPDRVRQWIDRHHLIGVCAFDIDSRTMSPVGQARPAD